MKQQMHQVPLGFTMVHVCVPMLKLLVSLGIVFPSADDLSPKGLQQQVTQREQGVLAFRAESRRLVHSPFPQSFFSFKSYRATKTGAGFSGSRGRSGLETGNTETEKSWDVSEHSCSEKRVSLSFLTCFSGGKHRCQATVHEKAVIHCHVGSTLFSFLWGIFSVTGFCKREYSSSTIASH